MKILKYVFPISFMTKEKNSNSLVISILLYAAVILSYFLCSGLLGFWLGNVIAWLLGLFGTVVGLYCTGGIVLNVLLFCGILK